MKQADWKRLEIGGGENSNLIQTSTARNRRTVLQGKMLCGDERNCWGLSARLLEGLAKKEPVKRELLQQETKSRGRETFWKRVEITGRYPGERDRAGVAEQTKSQFNKEKWLPLVYTPFLISHMCCHKMKKQPMHSYQSKHKYKPILATLAEESRVRKQAWIRHGCNAFDSKNPMSQPMSFWTEQDVLAYIVKYNLPIASVYGEIVNVINGIEYPPQDLFGNIGCNLKCSGCQRTGCSFCGFGMHNEKGKTRFQILAEIEPKKYEYAIGGGQWVDNPHYDPTAPKYDGEWLNWNPKQIWVPSKKGLGMGKVFDMSNEIFGKDFYRYE